VGPTVAVVFPGPPLDRRAWSGSPAGLAAGLGASGATVVPVRAELPFPLDLAVNAVVAAPRLPRALRRDVGETLRLARGIARASPGAGALQGVAASAKLRRLPQLDAFVQIGCGYVIDSTLPFVTFEDLTVAQAVRLGYPEWRLLGRRAVRTRLDRQRRVYERARACCLTTSFAAASVVEDYGIAPEKVHVVGIGRNHEPLPAVRDWRAPRFLFVGRHWEEKNGPAVLRAFAALRREVPEARLDVVGDHPRLDLDGVVGHGPLPLEDRDAAHRLAGLYAAATCFLLPSRFEAVGIVYAEAAAAGIASIGTTAGGSADIIGDAGRVVDPDDDAGLLAAMRELADPATAEALGARARLRSGLFTWEAVGARVLRALGLGADGTAAAAEPLSEPLERRAS
jgi:glycosyltransferase involved in cell wall biosynthesis